MSKEEADNFKHVTNGGRELREESMDTSNQSPNELEHVVLEEGQGESSSSSSSSSSDGSNVLPDDDDDDGDDDDQPNQPNSNLQDLITQPLPSLSLLQAEPHAVFETSGLARVSNVGIPQSQQARTSIAINGAQSSETLLHFPSTSVESSQPGIQSLNPQQDMSVTLRNQSSTVLPSQNGINLAEQEMSLIFRNHQLTNLPSRFANIQTDHLVPSHQTMGMVNPDGVFPNDQPIRNFGKYGTINTYHLPTSNLPPEFRLESSSRVQLPPIQQPPHSQTPAENGNGVSSFMKTQWANWQPQNQIPILESSTAMGSSQEIQFQGLLNQASTGPSSFYPSAGSAASQLQVPNLPIQPVPGMSSYNIGSPLPLFFEGSSTNYSRQGMQGFVNSGQYEMGESSSRPVTLASWIPQVQGSQGYNYSTLSAPNSRLRPIKNTVYDPMYEAMGLPVDPHLRMFVARRDNGNEEL